MASVADIFRNFKGAAREAERAYNANAAQQATAPRLLRPDEVAGDYDAARLLTTTIGGELRAITASDLVQFKRNAESLGKRFKGGITAKGVIDRSLKVDRDRANAEIRMALPRQHGGGKMHFITNAGPNSEESRHHLLIEFLEYEGALSSPSHSKDLAKKLATGALRFHCDCGRHKYWYSYIASIGKFNAGPPQLGFPKIRNPHLVGVGCKHVLRVMQVLSMPLVRDHLAKMIDTGRRAGAAKVTAVARKDAVALAKHQEKTAGWKRTAIETTPERKLRLAQQRRVKEIVDEANTKVATTKPTPTKLAAMKKKFEAQARMLAQMGGISQKMLAEMLAKLHGKS